MRTIREQAFADTDCKTVILPPGIYEIEKWAFKDSHLEQLYFYDDLTKVSDYAFQGCDLLSTLHINAIESPAYSGNYFDTFQDKYDRLLSMKEKKKIVLFSGSSTRFGYDSEMIDQVFSDYEVVNMGVFAYSPALWLSCFSASSWSASLLFSSFSFFFRASIILSMATFRSVSLIWASDCRESCRWMASV